jgi:S-adenosylmethionine:tRNA ribosyltransferase-isomerase
MKAADLPFQRHPAARLLAIDRRGNITHLPRTGFTGLLREDDLVIANDAATLPASLYGRHARSGAAIEVRLAGKPWLLPDAVGRYVAVVFGSGDFSIRTEQRPLPPPLAPGDRLHFGSLSAQVEQLLDHPRLVCLRFDGDADHIWAGLARQGRPIQYAHVRRPLALWDVWTPLAGPPVAFEPPSAGFVLDWQTLAALRESGARFATLTHAAGISSTGDAQLDARLPFPETYRIPAETVAALAQAKRDGGRVIAVGTTVVRALEHAAMRNGSVRAGPGLATQRIGASSSLRVVDAILSGTHEEGTSHYELLRAFADDATLTRASRELEARGYLTHEFGDSVLIEKAGRR